MGSGKKCRFNGDIADISGTAAITADARFQHPFAESGLEFVIHQTFDLFFRFREFLCHCCCCIIMQFLRCSFPFLFITDLNNTLDLSTQGLIHCCCQVFVGLFFRYFPFFGFYLSHDLFLQSDDLLNILMGEFQCIHEYFFWDHIRFAFHHDDGLAVSRNDQFQRRFFYFSLGRIDNEIVFYLGYPHRSNGAVPGNVGYHQCCRCAYTCQYICWVLAISR